MIDNYTVVYENLPHKVNAFTMYNSAEDYYTIVLNSRMSFNIAQKAFKHELRHIQNEDFISDKSIDEIEYTAHS